MVISIISSSVRVGRQSHKAALAIFNALEKRSGVTPVLLDLKDYDLPPLIHVRAKFPEVPKDVAKLGEELDRSNGIIFVSPEYNGSYCSALKNAIDFYPKSTYMRKPIGVTTASSGAMGGMRAALQLQLLVLALKGIASPEMLLVPKVQDKFDEKGQYKDGDFHEKVKYFLDHYLWLAEKVAK